MHYPFTAFSKNGKPTIRNIVPMNGKVPYVELSDGDAQQTNAMYKCDGKDTSNNARFAQTRTQSLLLSAL